MLLNPHFIPDIGSVWFSDWDRQDLLRHRDEEVFLKMIAPWSPDEFHWVARCMSPGTGAIWTPETDRHWPFLFRKILRYITKIPVALGSATLPHDVAAAIASFI